MPHCILEYSDNIPQPPDHRELFQALHTRLVAIGSFRLDDIKSRALIHRDFVMGDGRPANGFVTLNIAILTGRDDDFKQRLSQAALDVLTRFFEPSLNALRCSLTVQISEIHRESYQKNTSY